MPRRWKNKEGEDVYETPEGEQEQDVFAARVQVPISTATPNEFHSQAITIGGKRRPLGSRESNAPQEWGHQLGEIPGLNCPDCNAQAFKTDNKHVAVCGAYPGWYFFYRRLEDEHAKEGKMKLVILGGKLVEVPEEEPNIHKAI